MIIKIVLPAPSFTKFEKDAFVRTIGETTLLRLDGGVEYPAEILSVEVGSDGTSAEVTMDLKSQGALYMNNFIYPGNPVETRPRF